MSTRLQVANGGEKGVLSDQAASIRVLMMPDYREGNPYQQLLADALAAGRVNIHFPFGYRRVFPIFRALADAEDCDLLHLHWFDPYVRRGGRLAWAFAAKFMADLALVHSRGIPIVWTLHNLVGHDSRTPRLDSWLRGRLIALSAATIVHSDSVATTLRREYPDCSRRVHVVPHGNFRTCYPRAFSREEARRHLQLPHDGKLLLHFGSLRPYKGIEALLRIWQESDKGAYLAIIGPCRDDSYVLKLVRAASTTLRVILRPEFVPAESVSHYFAAADLAVLPYRQVTTSSSVILAAGFGTPVIAPRLGDIPEVLADADDLLYDAEDPSGLGQAIAAGLRADLGNLSARTLAAAERLQWSDAAARTAEIYRLALRP